MEADNDPAYDTVPMGDAIPVAVFGDHVEQRHARNNKPFKDEYDVRPVLCCDRKTLREGVRVWWKEVHFHSHIPG